MQSEQLIRELTRKTDESIRRAESLKNLDTPSLTWRPDPKSWNILECLAHLNLYGNFYLPEMEKKISGSKSGPDPTFKSGLLGGYFAKSMLPKRKLNKMKTFKDKDPLGAALDKTEIDAFIDQQRNLLQLLNRAGSVSLNKVKIEISISKFIKLKLGDTFLFYVNHITRHLKQIDHIEADMKSGILRDA